MAIEKKYVETPLMKQYYAVKAVHPDAILLFRVGDFYETFGDDAIKAPAYFDTYDEMDRLIEYLSGIENLYCVVVRRST